LARNQNNVF